MTNEEGKKLSPAIIALIVVAAGLAILVCCILLVSLGAGSYIYYDTQRRAGDIPPAVMPGVAPPEEEGGAVPGAGDQGATQPGEAELEATPSGPRRLELEPTPTPFYVTSEEDPRSMLDLSRPDAFDYFDNPDAWFDYDAAGYAAYHVEDGLLHGIDYTPEDNMVYWSFYEKQSGNTYAEITATNGDCIGKDAVGLVIRIDPERTPSGYAAEVSCDGNWRFIRHRQGKHPEPFIEWTANDFINTGEGAVNRIGLWGYQGKFYVFVNGELMGEYWDSNYPDTYGYFGTYVQSAQTFDLTAQFDDFAFWHIPFIP
jgi:hypothetical protein